MGNLLIRGAFPTRASGAAVEATLNAYCSTVTTKSEMAKKETAGGKESKEKDLKEKELKIVDKPSSTSGAESIPGVYAVNSKVLCKHNDNLYYEAKIISVETINNETVYTVHYQGWNQRHDEKIKHSNTDDRFLEHTPENVEKAKADMRDAQTRVQQAKKKGKKSTGSGEEKKNDGSDSRPSTPSEKRGASSSRAASITSEKGTLSTTVGSASSTTRKRKALVNEVQPIADFVRKEEIKIVIPPVLKDILVDDQDMIVRQMHLARLPARSTVTDIIRQYAEYMDTSVEARDALDYGGDDSKLKTMVVTLIESSLGVQDYFDSTLGSQLLYKFERPQYLEQIAKCEGKKEPSKEPPAKRKRMSDTAATEDSSVTPSKFKPSECYGFVHLLRLFVRFGKMLGMTTWSERAMQSIVNHVHNFLKFLEMNRHKFFDIESDYVVAPPEYQRQVYS